MALQAVGPVSTASSVSRFGLTPAGKSVGVTAQATSSLSTIVVSKRTVTNSDGSTTTIITYADGHTETETIPAKQSSAGGNSGGNTSGGTGGRTGAAPNASGPQSAPQGAQGATGTRVNLLV